MTGKKGSKSVKVRIRVVPIRVTFHKRDKAISRERDKPIPHKGENSRKEKDVKDRKECNFLKAYKAGRSQSVCTNTAIEQR
jgi:hypothetical protein